MRRIPRWLLVVLAVVAAVVALRLLVFRPSPVPVEVARIEPGTVEEIITNTRAGTVKARLRAKLSPQIGGRVTELPFRKGTQVQAGALLLKLDDSVQLASVRLAQEQVKTAESQAKEACLAAELAEKELRRGKALSADGITSQQDLDTLESNRDRTRASCQAALAARDQAHAQVGVAQAELALTVVRAPFAGVIADCSTEVGEWITPAPPGVPIPAVLDLIDPGSVYVSAPIDEVDSERVRAGQEVRVTVDSLPGQKLAGTLARVAPYVLDVLEQNRTVEIEVDLLDARLAQKLLPGTSADVEVILARREGVPRIPTAAIAEGGKVLVLKGGRLGERTITAGMRNWQFTEVKSGVTVGELVVISRDSPEIKPGARAQARESR
ncbi:MAG TPA: efflux RND transporter periplasmic adaptor subunit [Thermoanaerobaculaceae bacterium]|nr:efflux RND transporter periplasmic adaptor subunit [Thermoanaerobaculaceae bacterium]